ncbi:MAG: PilT/PilU family type 4a pilus ATPase [Dehalococcoidia bacterium]|nr:MAG: PilT/PilU family type 4a pilus ATPase [Dehalococcoidia bacterium]
MDIIELLSSAKNLGASDLHMVVASPPMLRIDGSLTSVNGSTPLTATEINEAFLQVTSPEDRDNFYRQMELDFGYSISGVGQFRCNAAMQRGAISLAIRLLPAIIPTIDELELPQVCKQLIMKPRGLIIVTGPTGSGKTTTLAAMINHLNMNDSRHILTIEDPIEYVHPSINCAITQRELGSDTHSFAQALKHVLRQDPDVILVGEMRDLETAASVLNVAETGHLILSTGHAPSAPQAMERIIDLFPTHERGLAQSRLASLLIASLCQTLVPRAEGSGRVAAVEIMMANPAIKNLLREGKTYQLHNAIRTHRDEGMITLDEVLVELYLKRVISGESVIQFCNDRQEVEKLIGRIGA